MNRGNLGSWLRVSILFDSGLIPDPFTSSSICPHMTSEQSKIKCTPE